MSAIEKLLDWYENLPENDKAEWRAKDILPHIIMTQAARINAVEQAEARAHAAIKWNKMECENCEIIQPGGRIKIKDGKCVECGRQVLSHELLTEKKRAPSRTGDPGVYWECPAHRPHCSLDRTEELVKRLKEWRHDYAHKPLLSATTLMDRFDVILRDFEGEK